MITVDAAKALAKRTLSPRRYEHTLNVRRLAVRLAKKIMRMSKKQLLRRFCTTLRKKCRRTKCCSCFRTML